MKTDESESESELNYTILTLVTSIVNLALASYVLFKHWVWFAPFFTPVVLPYGACLGLVNSLAFIAFVMQSRQYNRRKVKAKDDASYMVGRSMVYCVLLLVGYVAHVICVCHL